MSSLSELNVRCWLYRLAPNKDGHRVPRAVLNWETSKVLSERASTNDGIAGWHFPERSDLMSLTRWAVTKSIELEKQEEYISMGIPWYFIYNANSF